MILKILPTFLKIFSQKPNFLIKISFLNQIRDWQRLKNLCAGPPPKSQGPAKFIDQKSYE